MNENELKKKTVVCYGEVLWDIFPTKTKPGGAPMNVAYHLHKFGIDSRMISKVGADLPGEKLLNLLNEWEIPTANCQVDTTHQTGKVEAIAGDNNEMSYIIHSDVAWDHIQIEEESERLVSEADAFVFGSLVTRNETSRNTLYKLLEKASYKVFDVNLRPPFYSREVLEYLLDKCNLLKLNSSELEMIFSWYSNKYISESDCVNYLQNRFHIAEIIVTKGSEGATYYIGNNAYFFPAFEVSVKDTVGSGDSFLAAFLAKKIQSESTETGMLYATALGAFVASHEGACPPYQVAQLNEFIRKTKRLTIQEHTTIT